MLFEILTVIFAVITPVMCYLSFVKGYNLKAKENKEAPITLPKVKVKSREERARDRKAKEEQDALRDLFQRINDYSA